MYNIEDVSAIRNWEWQNYYKDKNDAYQQAIGRTEEDTKVNIYGGKWNEYQAKDSKKGQDKIRYKKGDKYRTETADVWAGSGSEGSKTGQVTNNKEEVVDSLNLDFVSDIQFKKTWDEKNWNDFDIVPDSSDKFDYVNTADSTAKVGLRIHSTFNFGTPYKKRTSGYDTTTNPEDVLYVRIESEPIWNLTFRAPNNQNKQYASVRQIIININESNMDSQYRPLMFFYAGAEKINNASKVRDSQPIILNLNADARIVFFCPNTPIVINGNGYILRGFVVAKEFRRLTTADDYSSYTQEGKTRYKDKITNEEYFLKEDANGNKLFTDEYGNVQTKLLTENDVRDPDYIGKLTSGSSEYRNQYLQQISTDKLYLWNLVSGTPDSEYARCLEMPLRGDLVRDWDYEKVYKLEAFNLSRDSYYDSFQLASLKRKVYVYLDGYRYDPSLYANSDGSAHDSIDYYKYDAHNKSVDMFFTTVRAGWID